MKKWCCVVEFFDAAGVHNTLVLFYKAAEANDCIPLLARDKMIPPVAFRLSIDRAAKRFKKDRWKWK